MTSDEVKSAFLAQCRPDISTLVLTAAVVTYWSVVAGISPEDDEKSRWGLYAGASAGVAFVLKDGAGMVSRSGALALRAPWSRCGRWRQPTVRTPRSGQTISDNYGVLKTA